MYASALPRENRSSEICVEISRKPEKKHFRHCRSKVEKGLADFDNFWQKYFWCNWLLNKCFGFHSPNVCFALPGESRLSIVHVKMNEKTSKVPSILICGPQQPVYYKVWLSCSSVCTRWSLGMFEKSRSDWYSLDWSEAKHYRLLLSMNGESLPLPVFA